MLVSLVWHAFTTNKKKRETVMQQIKKVHFIRKETETKNRSFLPSFFSSVKIKLNKNKNYSCKFSMTSHFKTAK
jgi:hypothetical protein